MGTIILIIAAVTEAAFGTYCIVTKSNQKKFRSWVRIAAFLIFTLFTVASVIKWGFKWKLLALTLLIWVIISAVSLIRRKNDKKDYKPARIVLKAVAMWLIVLIAVTPALIFPQYKLPAMTGGYKVNTVVVTYTDQSRIDTFSDTGENRKVTAEFWYPADADGTYPLAVFSHGAFGIKSSNTSTYMELASNGYVVCSIDHPHHSMFTVDTDGNFTMVEPSFIQEVVDVNNAVYDDETAYKLEQNWLNVRTEDMNFVIDMIIGNTKDTGSDEVYQLVDTGRIGLFGHSLGGAASAKVGRDRDDVDAVINLDGDLLGEYVGFYDGQFVLNDKVYPRPILNIYSNDMMQAFAKVAKSGIVDANTLLSNTAPVAFDVYIKGTNHMSLTDLPLFSPLLVKMICSSVNIGGGIEADKYYVIETMNRIILEFFNCYLKGEGTFNSAGTY